MNISEFATNYSRALMDCSKNNDELTKIYDELHIFLDLCNTNPKIAKYLSNLFYPKQDRRKFLSEILASLKISAISKQFIYICFENFRINNLNIILEKLKNNLDIINNNYRIDVFSVNKLAKSEMNELKKLLTPKNAGEVYIKNIVDESLISGMKIIYNNLLIDMSLSRMIKYYKANLIKN